MYPHLKDSWSGPDLAGLAWAEFHCRVRSHGHQEEEDRYSRITTLAICCCCSGISCRERSDNETTKTWQHHVHIPSVTEDTMWAPSTGQEQEPGFSRRGVKVRTWAGTNCWAVLGCCCCWLGPVTEEGEVSPVSAQGLLHTNHCPHCHGQGCSLSPVSDKQFGKSGWKSQFCTNSWPCCWNDPKWWPHLGFSENWRLNCRIASGCVPAWVLGNKNSLTALECSPWSAAAQIILLPLTGHTLHRAGLLYRTATNR